MKMQNLRRKTMYKLFKFEIIKSNLHVVINKSFILWITLKMLTKTWSWLYMDIERSNILKIFSQKCFPMTSFVSSLVCSEKNVSQKNANIFVRISQNFAFYRRNEAKFHEKNVPENFLFWLLKLYFIFFDECSQIICTFISKFLISAFFRETGWSKISLKKWKFSQMRTNAKNFADNFIRKFSKLQKFSRIRNFYETIFLFSCKF